MMKPKTKAPSLVPPTPVVHVHQFHRQRDKWAAMRLAVLAVAVFIAAVVVAIHFEKQFGLINWRIVALLCGAAFFVYAVYSWQSRKDNTYDVVDMVMSNGRADLGKHLIVLSFALSVWVTVATALRGQDVTALLLGVLSVFVLKEILGGFSNAMKDRPPPVDQSQNVNVLEGAQVAPKNDQGGKR